MLRAEAFKNTRVLNNKDKKIAGCTLCVMNDSGARITYQSSFHLLILPCRKPHLNPHIQQHRQIMFPVRV